MAAAARCVPPAQQRLCAAPPHRPTETAHPRPALPPRAMLLSTVPRPSAPSRSPPRVTDVHDALGAIDGVRFTTAEASYLTWIDVADAMPDVGMSAAEYFTEARRDHRRDHY